MWSLKNEQFYWHEQTCVTQLSETWLDIWVLFSRMFTFEQMVWRMGKFWNSRWWVGIFDAFWSASWWGFRSSKLPTYPGIWPKFFKEVKSPAFCPGKHGLFWSRSVQNANYRLLQTIVFTMQSERDKNGPTDCLLTLKTMVCIQSAVCILYCPVLEWTGT